jgi:hypothetical protein
MVIIKVMPFKPTRALSVDTSQGSDRKREDNSDYKQDLLQDKGSV